MTWVADLGVLRLRSQVDAAAPGRRKGSDGIVGDLSHQSRTSDHNPEHPPPAGNPDNQVDAIDLTHDPERGADMAVITEAIRRSKDRRVRYVIFRKRIFSSYAVNGRKAWEWGPYDGSDPHDKHAHVSVNDAHHDETQDWEIGIDMADTTAAVAAHWRQLAVLMLDPAYAARKEIAEPGRMARVPLIELLDRVDENLIAVKAAVVDEAGPLEIVLSTEQLNTIVDAVTRRVGDLVMARLSTFQFREVPE
jgi:hypothetical protein